MKITLTAEQERALYAVQGWYGACRAGFPADPFRLFGPAGTGKTTLARHIAGALGLDNVVFGAYTGKAAQVLRRKGVDASTIHSAIYRPVYTADLHAEHRKLSGLLAEARYVNESGDGLACDTSSMEARLNEIERELRRPMFELNPGSDWAHADLIVLDEVSMVDSQMAQDIESFGVPVLVLGDPEQFPPIGGAGHYTNETPDVLLTEIHRQALESPVLMLATGIRVSRNRALGIHPGEHETASVSRAMQAEQVLCWKNVTRWKLTERIRAKLDRPTGLVTPGDRIMCLVNNKRDLGVLNGQQFDVLEVKDCWHLLLKECGGEEPARWIEVFPDGFNAVDEAGIKGRRAFRGGVMAATFANVVTVHKAQGSEWESVYVIDETPAMMAMRERKEGEAAAIAEARRWLYTAVSRARESVTLARLRGQ